MKFNIKNFKGKTLMLKVRNDVKDGKNIYKDIRGFENETSFVGIDMPAKKTGLKRLVVRLNILYPGKVNKEFKMTRGHKHNAEEIYLFLEGKGYILVGKKKFDVQRGDLVTVPVNLWHRTVNRGRKKLVFFTFFERYES